MVVAPLLQTLHLVRLDRYYFLLCSLLQVPVVLNLLEAFPYPGQKVPLLTAMAPLRQMMCLPLSELIYRL